MSLGVILLSTHYIVVKLQQAHRNSDGTNCTLCIDLKSFIITNESKKGHILPHFTLEIITVSGYSRFSCVHS